MSYQGIYLIGLTGNMSPEAKDNGNWVETMAPAALTPANLFESQLARRLGHVKK
jgi:hypothetical protein